MEHGLKGKSVVLISGVADPIMKTSLDQIAIFVQEYVDKLLRRRRWKFCQFGSGDEVFSLPRGCELAGRPIVGSSHVQ
jgi:hypothetical protein